MSKCLACGSTDSVKLLKVNGYEIYKCNKCKLIYTFPMPSDQQISQFYQGFLFEKPNDKTISKSIKKKKQDITEIFNLEIDSNNSNKKFLDYGGGTGIAFASAKEMGFDTYYFDIDEQSKIFVEENFGLDSQHILYETKSYENTFDFVLNDNVIEHVKDPKEFVKKLYDKVKPGGLLVLKTPNASNIESFFILAIWLLVYFKKAIKENSIGKTFKAVFIHRYWHCEPPRHLLSFSKESIYEIANQLNIKSQNIEVEDYSIPVFKLCLFNIFFSVKNLLLRFTLIVLFFPAIVLELGVIALHYMLLKLNVISKVGLIVRIRKND
jgi:2-polyprenyl-3-methyl-5-hydroxy-6-metoxy-1,4-benzoquinol methylase